MFSCKVTLKGDSSKMFQGHGATEQEANDKAWGVVIENFLRVFGEDWENHPANPTYPLVSEFDFFVKQCRHNGE